MSASVSRIKNILLRYTSSNYVVTPNIPNLMGCTIRGKPGTAGTSKMEGFVIIVNSWKPLTVITKHSILDVAAALDPLLAIIYEDGLQYDKKTSDIFSEKDAFSMAGNYTGENNSLPEHTYVQIIDHGGLLKVDEIGFSSTIYSSTLHVNVGSFFLKQAIKNLTFPGKDQFA